MPLQSLPLTRYSSTSIHKRKNFNLLSVFPRGVNRLIGLLLSPILLVGLSTCDNFTAAFNFTTLYLTHTISIHFSITPSFNQPAQCLGMQRKCPWQCSPSKISVTRKNPVTSPSFSTAIHSLAPDICSTNDRPISRWSCLKLLPWCSNMSKSSGASSLVDCRIT